MVGLLADAVRTVRAQAGHHHGADAYGYEVRVTLTPRRLLDTLLYSDVTPGYVRAIPAALVAFLDDNPRPLARMVAEVEGASTDAAPGKMAIPRPNDELRELLRGRLPGLRVLGLPAAVGQVSAGRAARQRQFDAGGR